jgi:hypothetical protein
LHITSSTASLLQALDPGSATLLYIIIIHCLSTSREVHPGGDAGQHAEAVGLQQGQVPQDLHRTQEREVLRLCQLQRYRLVAACISVASPDPDPDPAFHVDPDPDPTFHFDPDTDPSFQIKAQYLEKVLQ